MAPKGSTFQLTSIEMIRCVEGSNTRNFGKGLGRNDPEILELAESIKADGVIEPLIVVRAEDGRYELIAGERRFIACQLAGVTAIPVMIRDARKKSERIRINAIENMHRKDTSMAERAYGIVCYRKELKESGDYTTDAQVAKDFGLSTPYVCQLITVWECLISEAHAAWCGRTGVRLPFEQALRFARMPKDKQRTAWAVYVGEIEDSPKDSKLRERKQKGQRATDFNKLHQETPRAACVLIEGQWTPATPRDKALIRSVCAWGVNRDKRRPILLEPEREE